MYVAQVGTPVDDVSQMINLTRKLRGLEMIGRSLLKLGLAVTLGVCANAAQAQMPAGNAENGEKIFKKCAPCHASVEGQNKMGPSLHGVVGRKAGSTNYPYYGLASANFIWTEENIFLYLAEPAASEWRHVWKGQSRLVFKLPDAQARADVIAYLKTLK